MDEVTKRKVLDGLEDGLQANEILEGNNNGITILRRLRSAVGMATYRVLSRRLIMPNRAGRFIEKLDYLENLEDYNHLERRVLAALATHKAKFEQ